MISSVPHADAEPSVPVAGAALTSLQAGLLFDTLGDKRDGLGLEVVVLELGAEIDAPRLEAAWQRACARHEALRTSFRLTPAGPRQDIWADAAIPFRFEHVALSGAAERAWYVNACVQAERRQGFDLGAAPLQRVRLIRFDAQTHTLIWTNHHAVMDGRSRAIVLRDIVAVYADRAPGGAVTPFRAHIAWLAQQDHTLSERFWRERLRGFAAPTPLPAAFRPSLPGSGARLPEYVEALLPAHDVSRMMDFARVHRLTVNTMLQAAWALVLSRHAAARDVVFGCVRAGRGGASEGSAAVGLLITTPPVRVEVDEDQPLVPWLQNVRARWDDLRSHEHVPQRLIASWSEVPAPQRLFESLLVYDRQTLVQSLHETIDPHGLLGVHTARLFEHTGFPLTLHAAGTHDFELRLAFDPLRFGSADATRLLDQLQTVLRSLPDHAGGRICDVPPATAAERQHLLKLGSRATPYPRTASVNALFDAQCVRTPNAVALQLEDRTMSYAELGKRAHGIAVDLHARGIGRGSFVGIHVERSFDMIAALLGILKAGAASIALDMHQPPEQLAAILDEAGVRTIVSQRPLLAALAPVLANARRPAPAIVDLELTAGAAHADFDEPFVRAADPAHVMYTSGSTGLPKGAVLPHQAIVRTVCGTDYLRFAADETFFAFVPLTFDVAVLEIWGPLLNGGRLVLCPPGLPSLDVLAETIETQGVTTLWLTTALFEQMVDEQLPRLHRIRQLIVGGDVMSPAHARRLMHAFPALRLLNVYGPTEATVLITAQQLATPPDAPVPIGKPIPNARVYILDARLRPVPVGVPGEIYTGGAGLALGYLNRPELTAERFVADPYADDSGARMYRTGDLACWRDDGAIDFLGRLDGQVKIRGIRVELAAVESALTEHPRIREAVAVSTADGAAGKQLIAYAVLRPGPAIEERDVREFLTARLPPSSVPARVVFTSSIPRTVTGKFDRRALPAPPPLDAGTSTAAPARAETPAQIAVAGEVAALLGLADIGLDDDFYAFGGDSLLAMRLVARLRETFETQLTVRDLVAAPTVRALSRRLCELPRSAPPRRVPRLRLERTGAEAPPIFFLHGDLIGAGRYCADIAKRLSGGRSLYVLGPHGTDGGSMPRSIEAMARENCMEIRRYCTGPVTLGGYCNGGLVAFEMARQFERIGVSVRNVVVVDGYLFNLQRSPLASFIRREASELLPPLGFGGGSRTHSDAAGSWQERHDALVDRWYDVLTRYTPGRYAGRVSLFWSGEAEMRSQELTSAWQRNVPYAARMGSVPGTHLTAITRHLAETSSILAAALE